jgi:hypothetical protein
MHTRGEDVIVVTWWHLEDTSNRSIDRPATPRPCPGCQASSIA